MKRGCKTVSERMEISTIPNDILIRTFQGKNPEDIAVELGIDRKTVYKYKELPSFKAKLSRMYQRIQEDAIKCASERLNTTTRTRKILEDAVVYATETIIKLAQSAKSEKIRYDACKDILDRNGLKPIDVIETRDRVYSPEETASMKLIYDELEAITMRLSNDGSVFLLNKPSIDILPVASVTEVGSSDSTIPEDTLPPVPEDTPLIGTSGNGQPTV